MNFVVDECRWIHWNPYMITNPKIGICWIHCRNLTECFQDFQRAILIPKVVPCDTGASDAILDWKHCSDVDRLGPLNCFTMFHSFQSNALILKILNQQKMRFFEHPVVACCRLIVFRSTVRFPGFSVGEQNILVVAHRDSLRALFGHLEGVEAATVFDGTSQTAPLVYEFGTSLRWNFSHEIPVSETSLVCRERRSVYLAFVLLKYRMNGS